MKLSALSRQSMLWWRFIKLSVLAIWMILVVTLKIQGNRTKIARILHRFSLFARLFRRQFLNKDFLDRKCIIVNYEDYRPVGSSLDGLVAFAWICEKMKINVRIKKPTNMIWRHFENDNPINITDELKHKLQSSEQKKFFENKIAYFGIFFISSVYGHKILSKLAINRHLKKCADQWVDDNIKGDWVAVHYRGTDTTKRKCRYRYRISLDPYIVYLKGVIGDEYSIFACSDQAQFIDKMHLAFPGRVFSRDIERSHNELPIHKHDILSRLRDKTDNFDQEKDALIDLLILTKSELIYTTGSGFVDVTRYFNPRIKIISLDQRKIGRGRNNVPIPRKDLFNRLCRP